MRLRRLSRDCSGTAAVELALFLPAIAFIMLNVVDLSMYIYAKMQVDLAAHEAVGYVRATCDTATKLPATYPDNTHCKSTLIADMTSAAQSTSLGTGVTVNTPTEAYYCADAGGTLIQVAAISATPPATCTGTVSGSTSAPGIYMQSTASYTFTPVFPGASVASALTSPITRTAWIRLK